MAFVYNNVACGRLRGGINASQPYADLYPGDVHSFAQWTPGMYFYATITDALGNIEIVKVTDITGNRITIDRGQDNTNAKEWYDGAVINQRFNSAAMDTVIQKASRQVAFDPNGVLVAAYPHEKVFQLGQKIWWKHVAGTDWACVAGRYIPIESCLADRINSGVDTPTDRTYLMKTGYDSVTRVKLDLPATDGTVTKMVLRVRVKGAGRETFRLRCDDGGDPIVLISVSVQDYLSDFTNWENYCEDLGGYSKAVLDKLFVNMSTVEPDEGYVSEIEVQLYDIGENLLETLYPYSDMPTEEGRENWIPVPPCGEELELELFYFGYFGYDEYGRYGFDIKVYDDKLYICTDAGIYIYALEPVPPYLYASGFINRVSSDRIVAKIIKYNNYMIAMTEDDSYQRYLTVYSISLTGDLTFVSEVDFGDSGDYADIEVVNGFIVAFWHNTGDDKFEIKTATINDGNLEFISTIALDGGDVYLYPSSLTGYLDNVFVTMDESEEINGDWVDTANMYTYKIDDSGQMTFNKKIPISSNGYIGYKTVCDNSGHVFSVVYNYLTDKSSIACFAYAGDTLMFTEEFNYEMIDFMNSPLILDDQNHLIAGSSGNLVVFKYNEAAFLTSSHFAWADRYSVNIGVSYKDAVFTHEDSDASRLRILLWE